MWKVYGPSGDLRRWGAVKRPEDLGAVAPDERVEAGEPTAEERRKGDGLLNLRKEAREILQEARTLKDWREALDPVTDTTEIAETDEALAGLQARLVSLRNDIRSERAP